MLSDKQQLKVEKPNENNQWTAYVRNFLKTAKRSEEIVNTIIGTNDVKILSDLRDELAAIRPHTQSKSV